MAAQSIAWLVLRIANATKLQYDPHSNCLVFDRSIWQNSRRIFVKPRRLLAHLAFALFMLLSQQLGIAHEISHLSSRETSGPSGAGRHRPLPAEMQCSACLAFAAVGSVLTGSSPVFDAGVAITRAAREVAVARFYRRHRSVFHSRAPPFPR